MSGEPRVLSPLQGCTAEYFIRSTPRCVLFCVLSIISVGIIPLVAFWRPRFRAILMCKRSTPKHATHVLLSLKKGDESECALHRIRCGTFSAKDVCFSPDSGEEYNEAAGETEYKYFQCEQLRFVLLPGKDEFEHPIPYVQFSDRRGLNEEQLMRAQTEFGPNSTAVKPRSIWQLLYHEVLSPFYVFQLFAIILWYTDEYELYASVIALTTIISLAIEIHTVRSGQKRLYELGNMHATAIVRRDGEELEIDALDLVPGDIVVLRDQATAPADIFLLCGDAVVDEAMLTGESVPVFKVAPTPSEFMNLSYEFGRTLSLANVPSHALISGGTTISLARGRAEAVVVATGFQSQRGQLIRAIMHPSPSKFRFAEDSNRFVFCLCCIAVIGFSVSFKPMLDAGLELGYIFRRALDLITVAVPPALPATMSIGTAIATKRLQKKMIACTAPSKINVAGVADTLIADKTGTLTTDALDLVEVHASDGTVWNSIEGPGEFVQNSVWRSLLCCHGLSVYEGKPIGDPLDLAMFNATQARLFDGEGALVAATIDSLAHEHPSETEEEEDMSDTLSELSSNSQPHHPLSMHYASIERENTRKDHRWSETLPNDDSPEPIVAFQASNGTLSDVTFSDGGALMHKEGMGTSQDDDGATPVFDDSQDESRCSLDMFDDTMLADADQMAAFSRASSQITAVVDAQIAHDLGFGSFDSIGTDLIRGVTCIVDTVSGSLPWIVAHRYDFTSEAQRATVVVIESQRSTSLSPQSPTETIQSGLTPGRAFVLLKGAAERICSMCEPSTIPEDLDRLLISIARRGLRVLATAERLVPDIDGLKSALNSRDGAEAGQFVFTGLLVFDNPPREDTRSVIQQLYEANVRTIMCTGDHAGTAVAVARRVGILSDDDTGAGQAYTGEVIEDMGPIQPETRLLGWPIKWVATLPDGETKELRIGSIPKIGVLTGASFAVLYKQQLMMEAARKAFYDQPRETDGLLEDGVGYLASAHSSQHLLGDETSVLFDSTMPSEVGTIGVDQLVMRTPLEQCLQNVNVYARMKPEQKKELVSLLSRTEVTDAIVKDIASHLHSKKPRKRRMPHPSYTRSTLMIGDGANDVGALKEAGAGISLSPAEASVAAPFTYGQPSISCVLETLRESMAALSTSVSCFRFMAMYSVIQFASTVVMYLVGSQPSDNAWLYVDLLLIMPISYAMSISRPSKRLSARRPLSSLISLRMLLPLLLIVVVQILTQVISTVVLHIQPFYEPIYGERRTPDTTLAFNLSIFQYLTVAVAFNSSTEYRANFITNPWLALGLLLNLAVCLLLQFQWPGWLQNLFDEVKFPLKYNFIQGATVLADIAVTLALYFISTTLIERFTLRKKQN